MSALDVWPGATINVADDFDLPEEKRRKYAVAALDEIDVDPRHVRTDVLYSGYLGDTPDDCDCIAVSDSLSEWLNARDSELQAELERLKRRLRKKWSAA